MTSRYDGKPLLRVLECFVLDAVGELAPAHRTALERATPRLHSLYAVEGDWIAVVSQVMHFPPTLGDAIRAKWNSFREAVLRGGGAVDPEEFARMFVDANFADA